MSLTSFTRGVSVWIILAVGAPQAVEAQGAYSCPDMPNLNPNPPAPLGATPVETFAAGSIIIPMDSCYQRPDKPKDAWVEEAVDETYGTSASMASVLCDGGNDGDTGQVLAYGLIHRLLQDGVPVNWSIRAGKTGFADYDFGITSSTGSPVTHMSRSGSITDPYASLNTIRYAGGPFIIDESHASTATSLINGYGADFDDVSLHVAQVEFDAPVYKEMGSLPKVAVLDLTGVSSQDRLGHLQGSILDVEMDHLQGTFWDYLDHNDVIAGDLVSGGYQLAWVHSFRSLSSSAVVTKLEEFAAAGGSLVFHDEAIHAMEGYGDFDTGTGTYSQDQAPLVSSRWGHSDGGVVYNFFSSAYGNDNGVSEDTASDDYSDPAAQWGGGAWSGVGGAKFDWTPRCDRGYQDGVRRMVYSAGGGGTDDVEFGSWRHYDDNSDMGRVYYLGGYNWRKNTHSGFRLLLNTIFVDAGVADDDADTIEVSRSAPIIATVGGVESTYQGSYEPDTSGDPAPTYADVSDAGDFEFPHIPGHLRAIPLSSVGGATDITDLPATFDAADGIPTVSSTGCSSANGSCRKVWTSTSASNPSFVDFNTGEADNLASLLGGTVTFDTDDATALIELVLQGTTVGSDREARLGGIDRSTMAIIEPSPLTGDVRPTMIYVGGTDGMIHAICADAVSPCPAAGTELWAYIPRTQLPLLRLNRQRIDGSPKVADVFAAIGSETTPSWHTIMVFQTASGTPGSTTSTPAAYAIDVTEPGNPELLWELPLDGTGLNVAMGRVSGIGGAFKHATFVQTNNGTGNVGWTTVAVDTASGDQLWKVSKDYSETQRNANYGDVPDTAITAGVTAISTNDDFAVDQVLVPTVYGELWVLNADDGTSRYTDGGSDIPLFSFSGDFHPVGASASVYLDRNTFQLHALIVSGGYTDPNPISWSPANATQYAVSVSLETAVTAAPLDETNVGANGFVIDLGVGNRAFAPAVIAGNELFIVTDTDDANSSSYGLSGNTGTLRRYDIPNAGSSGATPKSTIVLAGGAAPVDVSKTASKVVSGSGQSVQGDTMTDFDPTGAAVEGTGTETMSRLLWLQTQ